MSTVGSPQQGSWLQGALLRLLSQNDNSMRQIPCRFVNGPGYRAMSTNSTVAFAAVLMLFATSHVVAKNGGVPEIDTAKQCRNSQRVTEAMLGTALPDAFERCLKSEQAARDLLLEVWETAPASVKARCAQPEAYSPSYVEWVTCGELERDVRKLRQERPAAAQVDRGCPRVQYDEEGSITSVVACPAPTRHLY